MRILFVVYDNEGYTNWFPQGIGYLSAVLLNAGHEVVIYNQDIHHYPDEHLTAYLDSNHFDAVGVGIIAGYYQYRKLLSISGAINRSKDRPLYLLGGHGPAPESEYFLKKTQADIAVIGEGEATIVELMDAISRQRGLSQIQGIAYRERDTVHINERRPLIADIDSIPFPAYHLFPIEVYRLLRSANSSATDFVMPLLSGRGCTFNCTFCYRMDTGFRPRSSESIIEEIQLLRRDYGITYIKFSDELLMSSVSRTVSLCEAFIKARLNIRWWCNGRLNYARPDVLRLMKEAGCVFINYGIEAMDDDVLRKMNKALTTKMVIKGIEATLQAGISPGYNILFGNLGDTRETLRKGVKFLLRYDQSAQLRTIKPVTPYPGCPLYYYAIEKGLLRDVEDFYENKHVNSDLVAINFTELSDAEFHEALYEANQVLIENYYATKARQATDQAKKLYIDSDPNFRGFRQN